MTSQTRPSGTQVLLESGEDVQTAVSTLQIDVTDLKDYASTGTEAIIPFKDRAARFISSDDFISSTGDNAEKVKKAIAAIQGSMPDPNAKGGVVRLPRGVLGVTSEITLNEWNTGADQIDSIELRGDGPSTSELRMVGSSGGKCVIKSAPGNPTPGSNAIQYFKLADLCTRGGLNGIRFELANRGTLSRVKAQAAEQAGIYIGNTFESDYYNIHAVLNGASGVAFDYLVDKQKTSTAVVCGYAYMNGNHGWEFGFMNYSAAIATASDKNVNHGYLLRRSKGFTLVSPGSETNGRAGICIEASASAGASSSTLLLTPFSHENNQQNGGWGSNVHIRSTDGTAARAHVIDPACSSASSTQAFPDFVVDGVGAELLIDSDTRDEPRGRKATSGGWFNHRHRALLVSNLNIPASTPVAVCSLGSTQGHSTNVSGETSCFAGTIKVVASTSSPSTSVRRLAVYELLVCVTQEQGKECVLKHSAGYLSGNVAGAPSFTWSINSANKLVATPVSNAAGNFWFEITTDSQVMAKPA